MNELNLKRIVNQFAFSFSVLLIILLATNSCADESSTGSVPNKASSVILRIKYPHMRSTRGDQTVPVNQEEGTINSLHLYLFNVEGKLQQYIDLSPSSPSNITDNNEYPLPEIQTGSYFAFLIANIEKYSNLPDPITKESLEAIVLKFDNESKIISKDNLPMACLSSEFEEINEDNMITIGENGSTLTAHLSFLCVKVRYTLLFNPSSEGISQNFQDKNLELVMEGENAPFVGNLVKETKLKYDPSESLTASDSENDRLKWPLSLEKYQYPSSGDFYPHNSEDPSHLEDDLTEHYSEGESFAYQGVIYIPENHTSDYSYLSLTAKVNGVASTKEIDIKDSESPEIGIQRGYMYDIITRMVDPWDEIEDERNKYRIYWPEIAGPGLYAIGIPGFNDDIEDKAATSDEIYEFSKNRGEGHLKNGFYYYDFKSSVDPESTFSLEFTNCTDNSIIKTLDNLVISESFEEMNLYGEEVHVDYIEINKNKIPSGNHPKFPLAFDLEDLIEVYWSTKIKDEGKDLNWVYLFDYDDSKNWYNNGQYKPTYSNNLYWYYNLEFHKGWESKFKTANPTYNIGIQFYNLSKDRFTSEHLYNIMDLTLYNRSDNTRVWRIKIDENFNIVDM